MNNIPFLSLKDVTALHGAEINEAVARVINNGWYLQGKENELFEKHYSEFIGCKHTIGCANGLDARIWIFRAYIEMGVMQPGDEVIVPANTYIATTLAITENCLVPVNIEPKPNTLEINDDLIEASITPRTKAIAIVHPVSYTHLLEDEILYLCEEFEKVEIIPLTVNVNIQREVPFNCHVNVPICNVQGFHKYLRGMFCKKTFLLYCKELVKRRLFSNRTRLKTWMISYVNSNFLLKSNQIKEIFKRANTNDVFYSYWGKCSNVLSVVYHGRAHFVSRYHGEWDLWEESSGNYVPLREREAACLDYAVFISHKGEEYYRSKYPQSKTCLLYTLDVYKRQLLDESIDTPVLLEVFTNLSEDRYCINDYVASQDQRSFSEKVSGKLSRMFKK